MHPDLDRVAAVGVELHRVVSRLDSARTTACGRAGTTLGVAWTVIVRSLRRR
ncbi:MAG TPA: hypothetical protein VIJ00_05240 [Nakamurella sp.]